MRIICIESSSSSSSSSSYPGAICVIKGCIYNVTKVIEDTEYCVHNGEKSNVWYELLETGGFLHSSLIFRELEDLPEEIVSEEEIILN